MFIRFFTNNQYQKKRIDLYENDCIFDKFETSISGDGQYYMTGSYNSAFHIYDNKGLSDTRIESSRAPPPMNQCMCCFLWLFSLGFLWGFKYHLICKIGLQLWTFLLFSSN